MSDVVTVLVSRELIELLGDDWSEVVQIKLIETPGVGTGYEMIARTVRVDQSSV